MTIGKLAKRCGVGVETIRFYEREGLISQPERRPSGYRLYSETAEEQVRFIRQAKDLGFSLKEIRELMGLQVDGGERTCDDVRVLAEVKIADIDEKIALLQRMRDTLEELITACNRNNPTERCPILRAIRQGDRS